MPSILCPAKLPLRNEGKIKALVDKQKLRGFIISCPELHKVRKEVLQAEGK
jgi:hypothetical protein